MVLKKNQSVFQLQSLFYKSGERTDIKRRLRHLN